MSLIFNQKRERRTQKSDQIKKANIFLTQITNYPYSFSSHADSPARVLFRLTGLGTRVFSAASYALFMRAYP